MVIWSCLWELHHIGQMNLNPLSFHACDLLEYLMPLPLTSTSSLSSVPSTEAAILSCFACNKGFINHSVLNHHTQSCQKGRKWVASALVKAKDAYYERQERKKQQLMELVAQPDTDGGDVLAGTLMAPTPEEHRVGVVPTMNGIVGGTHSSHTTPLGTDRCVDLLPDGDSNSSASLATR